MYAGLTLYMRTFAHLLYSCTVRIHTSLKISRDVDLGDPLSNLVLAG